MTGAQRLFRSEARPAMLASVTTASEADICLTAGADLIDAKDPTTGALGALDETAIAGIVRQVAGRVPVSATVGDLPAEAEVLVAAALRTAATGVDVVKIGFEPGADARAAIMALGAAGLEGRFGRAGLVAVLLADTGIDRTLIPLLARARFIGVMLDTFDKAAGSLPDVVSGAELEAFVRSARADRLAVGLAGSLRTGHIAALMAHDPDILGFRGALCEWGARTRTVSPQAVMAVRQAIDLAAAEHRPAAQ